MIFLKNTAVADKPVVPAESIVDKNKWFTGLTKEIIFQMLSFLGGVLTASINDFGALSPFGVAYTAAAGQKYLISAGLGAAAGYILTQDSVSALRYIAALVSAAVMSKLFDGFERAKKFVLLPSCIAFTTCFVTSVIVVLAGEHDMKTFLMFFGEAALGFASAYFLSSATGTAAIIKQQKGMSVRDIGVTLISSYLFLLSLSGLTVFGVSFARIIAVITLLSFSYIFKETGGAISGVCCMLVFSMGTAVGPVGTAYAVSGLMSGVFSYKNRYVSASVFLLSFGVCFLFVNGAAEKIYLLIEAAFSAAVFMSVPEKYITRAQRFLTFSKEPESNEAQRQVIMNRLKSASAAVGSMNENVNKASLVLGSTASTTALSVYPRVQEEVCGGCHLFDFCWNKNFRDCKAAFDEMNEILSNSGIVNSRNVPRYIAGCCVKSGEIVDCFNKSYIRFTACEAARNKIEKIRMVTAEQFGGICSMLSELSDEFGEGVSFDNVRAERIEEILLNEFSIKAKSVICMTDTDGRVKIEFTADEIGKDVRENELRQALEGVCSRELDIPVSFKEENGVSVCFCEKTKFLVETAAAKAVADREKLCGDSFESFYDGKGNYIVVLSDGMGSGLRAAVDSSLAAGMMAKFLRSGFSNNSSLRLVNSALLLKSRDESLATLDILRINLYNGKTEFFKAGAAKSLIKRNAKLLEINLASMPVGILKDVEFASADGETKENDLIVLASDGAYEYSGDAVRNALAVTLDEDVRIISENIVRKAKTAKGINRSDDITVIALRVILNR